MKCVCGKEFEDPEALGYHVAQCHLEPSFAVASIGQRLPWGVRCWCGSIFLNDAFGYRSFGHHLTAAGSEDVVVHYLECQLKWAL